MEPPTSMYVASCCLKGSECQFSCKEILEKGSFSNVYVYPLCITEELEVVSMMLTCIFPLKIANNLTFQIGTRDSAWNHVMWLLGYLSRNHASSVYCLHPSYSNHQTVLAHHLDESLANIFTPLQPLPRWLWNHATSIWMTHLVLLWILAGEDLTSLLRLNKSSWLVSLRRYSLACLCPEFGISAVKTGKSFQHHIWISEL